MLKTNKKDEAREKLITHNLRLIAHIVKKNDNMESVKTFQRRFILWMTRQKTSFSKLFFIFLCNLSQFYTIEKTILSGII